MTYTFENLIELAKQAEPQIERVALPVVQHTYEEFVKFSEQPEDLYPTITDFIEGTAHIKKQQRFRSRGFKVLRFTRGLTNLRDFVNKPQVSYQNRSINEQYEDGDRNAFVLHVQAPEGSLYYVLDYENAADPLVDYAL